MKSIDSQAGKKGHPDVDPSSKCSNNTICLFLKLVNPLSDFSEIDSTNISRLGIITRNSMRLRRRYQSKYVVQFKRTEGKYDDTDSKFNDKLWYRFEVVWGFFPHLSDVISAISLVNLNVQS